MSEESLRNLEKGISEISKKLDTLTKMSALSLVKDIQVQKERIAALSHVGLTNKQITAILGTTPHTVKQRLYEARKGLRTKGKQEQDRD